MSSSRILNKLTAQPLPTPDSPRALDSVAPTAPGKPMVSNITADNATITFAASTDAVGVVGYAAFLDGSSTPAAYSEGNANSILLTSLSNGMHSVAVSAFDLASNYSALSAGSVFSIRDYGDSTKHNHPVTLCAIGDSYFASCSTLWGPPSKRPIQNQAGNQLAGLSGAFANQSIISGAYAYNFGNNLFPAGTLYWNNTLKTVTLQANGDAIGLPVEIAGAGYYSAYSGDGVRLVYFAVINGIPNTTTTSSTFNINDFNINDRNPNGIEQNYFRSPVMWATGLNNSTGISKIYNLGISGDSPAGVMQRLSDVDECSANINLLNIGINNTAQIAEAKLVVDYLANLGSPLIVLLLCPAFGKTINKYNSELTSYITSNYPDVFIVDSTEYTYDFDAGTLDSDKYLEAAGSALHLNGFGCYLIGKKINAILSKISGFIDNGIKPNTADAFNASTNPFGNMITNGRFTGSISASGGPFSGNIGNAWTLSGTSGVGGIAIACSKKAFTDGRKGTFQSFDLTNPNAVNERGTLNQTVSSVLSPGDKVIFSALVQIKNARDFNYFYLRLADNTNFKWSVAFNANTYAAPAGVATPQMVAMDMGNDWVLLTMPEPLVIPEGAGSGFKAVITLGLANTVTAAAEVNIQYVDFRKIAIQ